MHVKVFLNESKGYLKHVKLHHQHIFLSVGKLQRTHKNGYLFLEV